MSDHLLHMQLEAEGGVRKWLTCHHDESAYRQWSERREDWPDEFTCRCDDPDCPCRDGEHFGCGTFGGSSSEVGDECRGDPEPGCWVFGWWDAVGDEILCGDWPEDAPLPMPVRMDGDDSAPELVYAAPREEGKQ